MLISFAEILESEVGLFCQIQEAINIDTWIKDDDEQKFEENISESPEHFNCYCTDDQDQSNTSIQFGCL